jgi:hypothetical protein
MWTTLGLLAALSVAPGQAGELDLTNVRNTFGFLGPTRPDNKLIPGDAYYVAFDIENVKVDDTGEVLYSMAMEVLDSKMKPQFKQEPSNLKAMNSLGGRRLPAFAHVDIGLDQPSGVYTLKVTVTDRATKNKKSLTREFEVLPPTFGLARLMLSSDPQGQVPAAPVGVTGQSIWVNFIAVGFKRGGAKDEPNLSVEMRVFDEKNEPTLAKALPGEVKDLPSSINHVPMNFLLALNRTGKFSVKLKATDNVSKKTAELSFPIVVVDNK